MGMLISRLSNDDVEKEGNIFDIHENASFFYRESNVTCPHDLTEKNQRPNKVYLPIPCV